MNSSSMDSKLTQAAACNLSAQPMLSSSRHSLMPFSKSEQFAISKIRNREISKLSERAGFVGKPAASWLKEYADGC